MTNAVAILKERMAGELRVLLTPAGAAELCAAGLNLVVESGAGEALGFADQEYSRAGCKIADQATAWSCPVILKYKAPMPSEFEFLRPNAVIAAVMHAEGDMELTRALLASGTTAYAFEFFRDAAGKFPLMQAGSTIAGYQAVIYGAFHLQAHLGGSGLLMAPLPTNQRVQVLIIGSGYVATAAADLANRMGATVTVLCSSEKSLGRFKTECDPQITAHVNTPERLGSEIARSDLVIGAILISTFDTPAMITAEMVMTMKRGSVIVDATSGYGPGYIETCDKSASLQDPCFERFGVLHIKIGNLPAAVPQSTVALVDQIYPPYLIKFIQSLSGEADDLVSRHGLLTRQGRIVHPELLRHWEATH